MSYSLTLFSTWAAVSLLLVGLFSLLNDVFFRYRSLLKERLVGHFQHDNGEDSFSVFRDLSRLQSHAESSEQEWFNRFQCWLAQSGTRIQPNRLIITSLLAGSTAGILLPILGMPWWTSAIGLLAGVAIPMGYVEASRKRRISQLLHQLPDAFDAMSRAVRSGQTVFSAMQIIGDDFQPPVSEEFAYCYEQQNLGVSVESSLRDLARRTGIMELQMFVVGILVQSRSGGDLNELLETLAHTIRNRLKLGAKLKAMTGEGRMQAIVLGVLPLTAFILLYFMAPEYIASLLERPWLLVGTLGAQALGALWIRSIIRLDV